MSPLVVTSIGIGALIASWIIWAFTFYRFAKHRIKIENPFTFIFVQSFLGMVALFSQLGFADESKTILAYVMSNVFVSVISYVIGLPERKAPTDKN